MPVPPPIPPVQLGARPMSPAWAAVFGPPATPPASGRSYLLDQLAAGAEAAALADDDALAHLRPEPTQEEFDAAFPPDPADDDREAPEDADEAAPLDEYDGPTSDERPWWLR